MFYKRFHVGTTLDLVYLDLRNALMLAKVCVLRERANSDNKNFGCSVKFPVIVVKISTPIIVVEHSSSICDILL